MKVLIREGHTVRYDVKAEAAIRSLHVSGTLEFAPDRDTQLNVGLLKIQSGEDVSEEGFNCDAHLPEPAENGKRPALLVGAPETPVDAAPHALIRLVYFDGMDKQSCPAPRRPGLRQCRVCFGDKKSMARSARIVQNLQLKDSSHARRRFSRPG